MREEAPRRRRSACYAKARARSLAEKSTRRKKSSRCALFRMTAYWSKVDEDRSGDTALARAPLENGLEAKRGKDLFEWRRPRQEGASVSLSFSLYLAFSFSPRRSFARGASVGTARALDHGICPSRARWTTTITAARASKRPSPRHTTIRTVAPIPS